LAPGGLETHLDLLRSVGGNTVRNTTFAESGVIETVDWSAVHDSDNLQYLGGQLANDRRPHELFLPFHPAGASDRRVNAQMRGHKPRIFSFEI